MRTNQLEFKIARIDLSSGRGEVEIRPQHDFDLYLGGRGLNAKLLFEGQPPGVDAYGADCTLAGVGWMVSVGSGE